MANDWKQMGVYALLQVRPLCRRANHLAQVLLRVRSAAAKTHKHQIAGLTAALAQVGASAVLAHLDASDVLVGGPGKDNLVRHNETHDTFYIILFSLYIRHVIVSFKDRDTAELAQIGKNRRWANIASVACRKLHMIVAAIHLDDLKQPPGNQLELMVGNRSGQHSIRINKQYRICFIWKEDGAHDVEIVDYHDER